MGTTYRNSKFKKSIFTPLNREKYVGKWPLVMRSSWETKLAHFLDTSEGVKSWASESLAIPYLNPITNKPTRYYPDFIVTFIDKNGNERMEIIEVKPYKQTQPPKISKGKHKRTVLIEAKNWIVNQAKWKAAKEFCDARKMTFRIITEKELGIN